jgi:hypothetical protein
MQQPAQWRGVLAAVAKGIEGFFFRHRRRIVLVHGAMFVAFVGLLAVPLFFGPPPEHAGPLDHVATFANYVIWGLWFPLVFLSVIATGRSWCGLLCPMGAAAEWTNRVGLQRPIPAWLQWPGTPVVSFVIVTIWGQTLGVRDHALALAILFGTVMAAALVIGFLYGRRKRAWCRHACPIGLMLGVYGRLGAVDFSPKRPQPGAVTWTEKTVCPTMIDLDRKVECRHCIECFRCVSPKAPGGLTLRFRRPGAEIEAIAEHHANLAEVLFLFTGTGAARGGFLWLVLDSYQRLRQAVGDWAIDHEWYWLGEPGPVWLMAVYPDQREVFRWLDFFLIGGYMLGWLVLITAVLSATTLAAAWLAGRVGGVGTLSRRFVELGYQYAPVAMVSLLVGLAGGLFRNLHYLGLDDGGIALVKAALFAAGALWSLYLGWRLLAAQGIPGRWRWLPLLPGATGSLAVGAAWYPAIF